jgi:hypothetical protein
MKKTVMVNVYIFKNVWRSNGSLYIKYNKRALARTIYTKIWFVLSYNIDGYVLL